MFFQRIYLLKTVILFICFFESFTLYPMLLYRGIERIVATIAKPTHTPVFMNHGDIIQLSALNKDDNIISTGGLVGCLPTILYVKSNQDQKQKVILTHYTWGNNEHAKALAQHIKLLHAMTNYEKFDYAHFFIINPRGKNVFVTNAQEHALIGEQQTAQLQGVVKDNLNVTLLDLTITSYTMPVPGQAPAQVHVILSNNNKSPSCCKIYTVGGCLEQSLLLCKE
jgi:hypothetical protein